MYTANLITNLLNIYENPVELFDKISIVGEILNKTEIEQKEYIKRLNNGECDELFEILMIIYETDYDLLNKRTLGEKITKQTLEMRRQVYKQKQLDFFSEESDKIINFRDVFISTKYKYLYC